jgi:hypothetical protein
MARWIHLLVIFYSALGLAAESCPTTADQFAMKPLNEFQNYTCEQVKKSPQCQQVYNQIKLEGGNPDSYALECKDRGQLMRALENYANIQAGCALGGWNFVKDTFVGLGAALGEGVAKTVIDAEKEKEDNAKCDKDPKLKKGIYTNYNATVPKLLQVEVPADEVFTRVPCAQLKAGLSMMQTRQGFVAMDKVRSRITDSQAKYSSEEKEYVDWIKKMNANKGNGPGVVEMAKKKIHDLGVQYECYNTLRATAMICEAMLDVGTLAAGGVGVAAKVTRIAGVAAKTEKVAAVSNAAKAGVDLEKAGALTNAERTQEAAKVAGRELSSTQKDGVVKAHEVGDGRTYRTNGGKADEYTMQDLRQKAKILKEADFTQAERRALMENGIVGNSPATTVGRADQQFIPRINDAMSRRTTEAVNQAANDGRKYYKAKSTASEAEFKQAFPEDRGVSDIINANYFGLGTEDSAALVNRYIQVYGYAPEQAKLAIISNLKNEAKYYSNAGSKVDVNISSYRVYRDKELEYKLTSDYYEGRYANKFGELDYDKLSPGQRKNLEKLQEEVQQLRKQAEKNKWPGYSEHQKNY